MSNRNLGYNKCKKLTESTSWPGKKAGIVIWVPSIEIDNLTSIFSEFFTLFIFYPNFDKIWSAKKF